HHILRLQAGDCSIEVGFVLSDLLTNLERVSDHCSNIAGCIIEMKHSDLDLHQYLGELRSTDENFLREYEEMQKKYSLA
ncbi:MAG: Na/Pi cotransporter family protein, partial [Clostridia bacterium]|nr:Na/Pi cotransporter family protein [Clostridia bacterium]